MHGPLDETTISEAYADYAANVRRYYDAKIAVAAKRHALQIKEAQAVRDDLFSAISDLDRQAGLVLLCRAEYEDLYKAEIKELEAARDLRLAQAVLHEIDDRLHLRNQEKR